MNKVKFTVLAIVAAFATSAAASDIEFHGYTRAGLGLNSNGGTAVCYRLFSADTDYRLGNECDYVIEPNFEITMAKLDDKSSWGFHFMPKVYKRWPPMGGRDLDPLALWVGQVYFFGNNLPWLANGSIWAGRKYWDRLQLGINDQFLENEDSDSFGVENMDLGVAKLSVGFGLGGSGPNFGDTKDAGSRQYKIAARLTGIQTFNKDSSLQIWAAYYGQSRNSKLKVPGVPPAPDTDLVTKIDSGYRFALYHNFGFGTYGNLFVGGKIHKNDQISGMDGSAGNIIGSIKTQQDLPDNDPLIPSGAQQWRVFAQYGVSVPSIRTSFDFLTEYRDGHADKGQFKDAHLKWFTVGARADAQISGPFRFLLEAGYDRAWATQDGNDVVDPISLVKVTPALAISAGNDPWSRPTFRLYYTYATWTDPTDVGLLGTTPNALDDGWHSTGTEAQFPGKTSGGTFGVQAEGWW